MKRKVFLANFVNILPMMHCLQLASVGRASKGAGREEQPQGQTEVKEKAQWQGILQREQLGH